MKKNTIIFSSQLLASILFFPLSSFAGTIGIIDWNTVLYNSIENGEPENDIIALLSQSPKEGDDTEARPNEIKLNLKNQYPETGLTLAGYVYLAGSMYKNLLQEIRIALGCPMIRFANNEAAESWSKDSILDPNGCAYGGDSMREKLH